VLARELDAELEYCEPGITDWESGTSTSIFGRGTLGVKGAKTSLRDLTPNNKNYKDLLKPKSKFSVNVERDWSKGGLVKSSDSEVWYRRCE